MDDPPKGPTKILGYDRNTFCKQIFANEAAVYLANAEKIAFFVSIAYHRRSSKNLDSQFSNWRMSCSWRSRLTESSPKKKLFSSGAYLSTFYGVIQYICHAPELTQINHFQVHQFLCRYCKPFISTGTLQRTRRLKTEVRIGNYSAQKALNSSLRHVCFSFPICPSNGTTKRQIKFMLVVNTGMVPKGYYALFQRVVNWKSRSMSPKRDIVLPGWDRLGFAVEYFPVYFEDICCFGLVAVAATEGYVQNFTGKVIKKHFKANPRNR